MENRKLQNGKLIIQKELPKKLLLLFYIAFFRFQRKYDTCRLFFEEFEIFSPNVKRKVSF